VTKRAKTFPKVIDIIPSIDRLEKAPAVIFLVCQI
jgi:hypothetical protein